MRHKSMQHSAGSDVMVEEKKSGCMWQLPHLTVQEGEDRDDLKFWCGPLDQQIYYHHFVLYIKLGLPLTSGA